VSVSGALPAGPASAADVDRQLAGRVEVEVAAERGDAEEVDVDAREEVPAAARLERDAGRALGERDLVEQHELDAADVQFRRAAGNAVAPGAGGRFRARVDSEVDVLGGDHEQRVEAEGRVVDAQVEHEAGVAPLVDLGRPVHVERDRAEERPQLGVERDRQLVGVVHDLDRTVELEDRPDVDRAADEHPE
jgi:hypothetical protein